MAKAKQANYFILVDEASSEALKSISDKGPVWGTLRDFQYYLEDDHDFMTFNTESAVKKMVNQLGLNSSLCVAQKISKKVIWEYEF